MIPVFILGGCSFIFDKELKKFPLIFYIRCTILVFAIIVVIGGFLELIRKLKKMK